MDVEVKRFSEAHDSFSVAAEVRGEYGELLVRHSFPKGEGFLEEDEDGIPKFIYRVKKIYEEQAGLEVSSLGNPEKEPEDYESEYNV